MLLFSLPLNIHPASSPLVPKEQEVHRLEDSESADVLKGLLQCIAGIGGMALVMWLIFYLVMPPQGFSDPPGEIPMATPTCTLVFSHVRRPTNSVYEILKVGLFSTPVLTFPFPHVYLDRG